MLFKKNTIIAIILFLGSLGYLLTFYNYGIELQDEGFPLGVAMRILQGEVGGRDFVLDPMIGVHTLYAFIFRLFGSNLNVVRLAIAYFTAFTIVLAYFVSKKLMSSTFAFLATILLLAAPGPYYARFFIILTFLNLLIIIKYLEKRSLIWLMIAGIVAGISFSYRLDMVVIAAAATYIIIVVHNVFYREYNASKKEVIKTTIREISLYSLVVITVVAPTFIYYFLPAFRNDLFFISSLSSLYNWCLPFPRLTLSIADWTNIENLRLLFENFLFYLTPLIYLVTLFLIIHRFILKKTRQIDLYLILFLTFGGLSFYRVILRPDFEHLLHVMPCAYILGCYFLFQLWQKGRDLIKRNRSVRLIPNLLFNASLFVVVLPIPIIFIINVIFYHGFAIGSIGVLKGEHTLLNIPRAKIYCSSSEAAMITHIVDYIKIHTNPEEKIYAISSNPIWYFFCNRNSTTHTIMLAPHNTKRDDSWQRKFIKTFDESQVKYIIYNDWLCDRREDRRFRYYARLVEGYIGKNYHFEEKIGNFDILRRNEVTNPYPFIASESKDSFDFIVNLTKAKIETVDPDNVRVERFYIGGEGREVLFERPPAEITYKLKIPPKAFLEFGIGIKPEAWSRSGDGVLFEISIVDAQSQKHKLFSKYIDPKNEETDRKWHDVKIDLSKYNDQEVLLSFATSSDLASNRGYDLAGWSEPRVVWKSNDDKK